jgi:hypothetical protein
MLAFKALSGEGPITSYMGATGDFCHVLVSSTEALVAGVAGTREKLYEVAGGCGSEGEGSLRAVGVDNAGKPINDACPVDYGLEDYAQGGQGSQFNAINVAGGEVFFTQCAGAEERTSSHQLFVRLDGQRTVEVSRPLGACVGQAAPHVADEVPCQGAAGRPSANFVGASPDGSRVYFTTTAALAASDTDAGNDLYLATIGCPEDRPECAPAEREVVGQTQVSHAPNGAPAEVLGVVRVAPDGSRVYYVATGDLLTASEQEGLEHEGRPVPEKGAANLYEYDANTGVTLFVGALCSGRELSGSVEDASCPSPTGTDLELWRGNFGEAQTAGADGRYLLFATYAQLTGSDANAVSDIYRFDAETDELVRVSGGEGGFAADGNEGAHGSQIAPGNHGGRVFLQYELNNRAISEDGSRIVFSSADALSPAVSNGLRNAYEWHEGPPGSEGSVSLISSGSSVEPVPFRGNVVISADGSGIFFETVDGLVPQDTDGAPDIYDARLGGGEPPRPEERRRCEGDACQGPLTDPAPLFIPGSISQAPGENYPPPQRLAPQPKGKPHTDRKKHSGKQHKKARRARRSAKRRNAGTRR